MSDRAAQTEDLTPADSGPGDPKAAAALAGGGVVVVTTDTVISAAVNVGRQEAPAIIEALLAANRSADPRAVVPPAWVPAPAPEGERTVEEVIKLLHIDAPVHRMLMRRLTPGPAIFLVPLEPAVLKGIQKYFRFADGLIEQVWRNGGGEGEGGVGAGAEIGVRIPAAHPVTDLAGRVDGVPVVLVELLDERGRWAEDPEAAAARVAGVLSKADLTAPTLPSGVIIVCRAEGRSGKPATVIRLLRDGGYTVVRGGAYEERFIAKQLHRRVLFVCSGNTCRSPMAEAIAADLIAKTPPLPGSTPIRTTVGSAGTGAFGAGSGMPPTPEAIEALQEMGVDASMLRGSRPLTRRLLEESDAVFVMTRSHLHAAQALDPSAADKIRLVDPRGEDIQDPLGLPREFYTETAERLRDAIAQRLKELDL